MNDFITFKGKDKERIAYWKKMIDMGKNLAEDFHDAVESGRIRHMVQPLNYWLIKLSLFKIKEEPCHM